MNSIHLRKQLPPLGALRVFEAAARHLSFKHAANELALTPTAVSHQVRGLEKRLGTPLFERSARQVRLTRAGQTLFPVVRDALDEMARTLAALRPEPTRRIVTVSATRAFTARWLVPRLTSFASVVPDIDLHLHASDEPADLRSSGIDLAVRYGGGHYPGLQAEPLLPNEFLPVCSPHLRLTGKAMLANTPLLAYEWRIRGEDTPDWPRWFREAGLTMPGRLKLSYFSDEAHAIQAAIAGHGVVLASRVLVADELTSGALRVPFGPVLQGLNTHLVWRPDHDTDQTLVQVRQWLQQEVAQFLLRHPPPTSVERRKQPPRKLVP